jgi:hypothetical protein
MDFYQSIPTFHQFKDVANRDVYRSVPNDWSVVITDVRGSTRAIELGHYKEINTTGVSSIIAVINALKTQHIPYVFGGDGATILIPSETTNVVVAALRGAQAMAKTNFGLELRVGVVPVSNLKEAGHDIFVARYQLSPTTVLAMISGSGVSLAEQWVKDPNQNFCIAPDFSAMASFDGLECRWNPIRTKRGEMVSLLVKADRADTYQEVLNLIETILHDDGKPTATDRVKFSWPLFGTAMREAKTRAFGKGNKAIFKHFVLVNFEMLVAGISWIFNIDMRTFSMKKYVSDLVSNTDFRKFDDMLRMIIDCKTEQRVQIETALNAKMQKGELVYGTHITNAALMTCLVFSWENHVHFVDGASGGYAMAAKQLKARMKQSPAPKL